MDLLRDDRRCVARENIIYPFIPVLRLTYCQRIYNLMSWLHDDEPRSFGPRFGGSDVWSLVRLVNIGNNSWATDTYCYPTTSPRFILISEAENSCPSD